MALEDIKQSIKWADEGGRVHVYFTAHFASFNDDSNKQSPDTVRYAIGDLEANPSGSPATSLTCSPHLAEPLHRIVQRPHEPVAHRGRRRGHGA